MGEFENSVPCIGNPRKECSDCPIFEVAETVSRLQREDLDDRGVMFQGVDKCDFTVANAFFERQERFFKKMGLDYSIFKSCPRIKESNSRLFPDDPTSIK